jgi:two-component system response regulator MprA
VQTLPLVLLVEDDARLGSFLDRALVRAGYAVERAEHALQALELLDSVSPDLLLLNDGPDLTRQLRERTDRPIILLSANDSLDRRIAGLDAGADDYLVIPFEVEELLARLRAVRRGRALARAGVQRLRQGTLQYADVCLDLDARVAWRGSRELELRNKGFELLTCFMRHPERVLSRRDLLSEAWGYEFVGDSNVIEVTVSHVRQVLEAGGEPRLIHTVRPIGYILKSRAYGTTTGVAESSATNSE